MVIDMSDRNVQTVFVVNDDHVQLSILEALIRKAGHEPRVFSSAEQALNAVDPLQPPSLVVTDLHMPGIDGWQLCRLMRSPEYAFLMNVPIIVVSATFYGDEPERIAADLGVAAFFTSPVDGDDFVRQVRAVLEVRHSLIPSRVLIVEDARTLSGMIEKAFTEEEYQVHKAFTIEAAKEALSTALYDLAVIDHDLADGKGDNLLELLKAQQPDCVCLMMTGDSNPQRAIDWMKRGAAAYLRKPFDPDHLIELCRRARRERTLLRTQNLLEIRTHELKESRHQFQQIFEGSRDGFVIVDEQQRITNANRAFCRMLGYSLEELRAMAGFQKITPSRWHQWEDEEIWNKRLLQEGYSGVYEKEYIRKDGSIFPVELQAYTVLDENGKISYLWGVARDISEHKQADASLRRSQSRYQSLTENFPNGAIFLFDEDFRYLLVGGESLRKAGLSSEELVGRTVKEVFPDLWSTIRPHAQAALRGEKSYYEVEYKGRIYSNQALPIKDPSTSFRQALVLTQDITERKRIEEALSKSEEKYRVLVENAGEAIFVAQNGRLKFHNSRTETMIGFSKDELTSKPFIDFIHPEDRSLVLNRHMKRLQGEIDEPSKYSFRIVHRSGKTLWVELKVVLIEWFGERATLNFLSDITDRKRAEGALLASEIRFRDLARQAPFSIQVLDLSGKTLQVNDEWNRLWGISLADIAHYNIFEDRQLLENGVIEHVKRAFCGENVIIPPMEYSAEKTVGKGQSRWVQARAFPVRDELGNIREVTLIHEDIGERKRAEEALKQSEAKYRALVENSTDIIWTYDLASKKYTFAAGALESTLGYSPNEASGMSLDDLFDSDTKKRISAEFQKILESNGQDKKIKIEATHRHKNGGYVPLEIFASLVRDDKERPVAFSGVSRDITERLQNEKALRESEERFRMLLNDVSMVSVQGYAPDGTTLYWNEGSRILYGYTSDEALGSNLLDLIIPPEMRDEVATAIRQMAETGRPIPPSELELMRKDGTRVQVFSSHCILKRSGRPQELYCVDVNLSAIKQAEVERERMREQLLQAQKMESVGRLAGGVAHDFNNMLGVILGHVELALQQSVPDDPLFTPLQEIQKAARRSADLTGQLLAFARKQPVRPKNLDLNITVSGMLTMLHRLIGENIQLVWRPEGDLWQVRMDPAQLDQILVNLCVNARDAIGECGKIAIQTRNVSLNKVESGMPPEFVPGCYVLLTVSDDGCGMDKNTLDKLFEPFFTTKGVGKGTGLGLATVYGIVRQNNGFVNVDSKLGQGTTFSVYLPRHDKAPDSKPLEATASPSVVVLETILVVEDEPMILNITKTMLERLGYKVLAAGNPREAIRIADEHDEEIHLLMTDVIMPEMNGKELAERVRSRYPKIGILFTSGYTADVIADHGVLSEGIHFIQKPFSQNDLATKAKKALDGRR